MSPATPVPSMNGVVLLVMPSPRVPLSLADASARPAGAACTVVSIVTASGPDVPETVPAMLVSMVVRLCAPAVRTVLVIAQVPLSATVAVPALAVPSYRVTRSPLVPVPVNSGVVTLVMSSPLVPLLLSGSRTGARGLTGAVLSMVSASAPDTSETVPARLVSVLVSVCRPLVRGVLPVICQLPAMTVAVPTTVLPPSYSVTTSPLTPVPIISGLVKLVILSPTVPLSLPTARTGVDGVAGVVLSMVSTSGVGDAPETLPAASVSVAVRVCTSLLSAVLVIAQAPPMTVALPTLLVPSNSVTTSPLSPMPLMTGMAMLVTSPSATPLSLPGSRVRPVGAGVEVAMVSCSDAEGADTLPAASAAVLVSVCTPSSRSVLVIVQTPPVTVAVPTGVLPSRSVTTSPL